MPIYEVRGLKTGVEGKVNVSGLSKENKKIFVRLLLHQIFDKAAREGFIPMFPEITLTGDVLKGEMLGLKVGKEDVFDFLLMEYIESDRIKGYMAQVIKEYTNDNK